MFSIFDVSMHSDTCSCNTVASCNTHSQHVDKKIIRTRTEKNNTKFNIIRVVLISVNKF